MDLRRNRKTPRFGPFGISPVTAHRWARLAGDSWSDCLATRQPAQGL
ncbi:hypothetical protein QFZ56_007669 [Streptomyces achromogenes]|uniref:Uncharacterized protein n=1 Tax=Streptomyces achromogenes TaxID=67255 RepID=A0ABU0QEV9_STRAH|nr:hypothetical protein [Streptomyces achromogenes]MDQ0688706.1 hypothetical protein [Streptomyces achromogenes]